MNGRVVAPVIVTLHHLCYSCGFVLAILQLRTAAESLSAL